MQESKNRLKNYNYLEILKNFLGGSLKKVFSGELVYPRQLEIHLPGDKERACDFKCYYCQGGLLNQALGMDEPRALKLIDEIGPDKCEYYIYGGAYTEPLLNPHLLDFLKVTKKHKVFFGIHTNGSRLKAMESESGFLTTVFRMMEHKDYVSVSLDAGTPESHMKTKNLDKNYFDDIIEGIRMMVKFRDQNPDNPAVRVCYLMNRFNSSDEEIARIVEITRELEVDSLRFSIPYDQYGKSFDKVHNYKETVEVPQNIDYERRLQKYISLDTQQRPFIFYFPPSNQDVDQMNYSQCIYTYYQITLAADGNVYRCSSIGSPTFSYGIIGPIPETVKELEKMILKGQDPDFRCFECFSHGARCNRMAFEINREFNAIQSIRDA
ncbi:MAG: radical SAM protein [Candidatus Omnitrophica bacterium]|nr:radical SAM protein [Candidatus Omnitrophota bacterium]